MTKKLNTYVHAVARDDKGNVTNTGTFGPDDDLSKPENAWVADAVTNPDVWEDQDGKADEAKSADPATIARGRRTPADSK